MNTSASFQASQVPSLRAFIAKTFGSDATKVENIIHRAVSFHPAITGRVWSTKVEWDPSLKRAAGQFHTKSGIVLHPGLLAADRKHLVETFLHELAHAMQWYAYAKVDHAETWWEMMHQLGQKPVRTHNIAECMKKVQPATLGLNVEDMGL